MNEIPERIVITRPFYDLCTMQVCAVSDVTDEEVLAYCNRYNPSGTSNGWTQIDREGKRAPVPCQDAEGRIHILVTC